MGIGIMIRTRSSLARESSTSEAIAAAGRHILSLCSLQRASLRPSIVTALMSIRTVPRDSQVYPEGNQSNNNQFFAAATGTVTAIDGLKARLPTVDGRNPAPPKNPWNDGSTVNTNKQWFPMVSKWCRILSIHSMIWVAPWTDKLPVWKTC